MRKIFLLLIVINFIYAGFLDELFSSIHTSHTSHIQKKEVIEDNDLGEPVESSLPPATEEIMGNDLGEAIDTPTMDNIQDDDRNFSFDEEKKEVIKEVSVEDYRGYGSLRIALLVPKRVIGSYANKVSNAILSYFILKGKNFEYEVFDSKDESEENLARTLYKIKAKGYNFVIAPLTKKGAELVTFLEKDMIVYIPTINIQNIEIKCF